MSEQSPRQRLDGFTIDSESAQILDDALTVEFNDDGTTTLSVSIADVARLVPKGCREDHAAFQSICFPEKGSRVVIKSLLAPETLSQASLSFKQIRPAITVQFRVSQDLVFSEPTFIRTDFFVHARLTPEKATAIINSGYGAIRRKLSWLYQVAQRLFKNRRGYKFKSSGSDDQRSWLIVNEISLITNSAVTRFLSDRGIPVLNLNLISQAQLESGEDDGELPFDNLAVMSTVAIGSYDLGGQLFSAVTSPLRSLAGLVMQRQLSAFIDSALIPYSSVELEYIAVLINGVRKIDPIYFLDTVRLLEKQADVRFQSLAQHLFSCLIARRVRQSGPLTDELRCEILERLASSRLRPGAVANLLFDTSNESRWREIRLKLREWLMLNPFEAAGIFAALETKLACGPVSYLVQQVVSGSPLVMRFQVSAHVTSNGQVYSSDLVSSPTAELAKSAAALGLLIRLIDAYLESPIRLSVIDPRVVHGQQTISRSWTFILKQQCKRNNWSFPEFHVIQEVVREPQIFSCVARLFIGEVIYQSEKVYGVSSKAAQQFACKSLRGKIRAAGLWGDDE